MTAHHTKKVTTFALAYAHGQVSLCERCLARVAGDPDSIYVPRLGPVQRGAHRGTCDVQLLEWDAEARRGLPFSDR